MKNIVAYIGSRRGKDSNTFKFVKAILDKTIEKNNNIRYEIITPNDINILSCKGCNNCFSQAVCILDNKDDISKLRDKIINSDFVILGSPIYAHNISGDMKIFIDRSSYWMHLMRLAGKGSMALTTTYSNGHSKGINYLADILTYYGSKVVAKYNASIEYPDQLLNEIWLNNTIEELSTLIINTITNPIETDSNLEQVFKMLKNTMKYYKVKNIHNGEWQFWDENGFLDCTSFKQVLEKIQMQNVE